MSTAFKMSLCSLVLVAACGTPEETSIPDAEEPAADFAAVSATEFGDDLFMHPPEGAACAEGAICAGIVAAPAPRFAGVFSGSTQDSKVVLDVTWTELTDAWSKHNAQGYRLVDIDSQMVGSVRRYSGVFHPGSGGHFLWAGVSWSNFEAKWQELGGQGLRLVDLEVHEENGQPQFTGVWRAGSDAHYLWVGVDWASFVAKWQELAGKGLRLIDIEAYVQNGQMRYAGVWRAGSGGYALWVGASWNSFATKWMEYAEAGLRLVDMEAYTFNGYRMYAGVFRSGSGGYALVEARDATAFAARVAALAAQGKRLVRVEWDPNVSAAPPGYARAFFENLDGHAVGYSFAVTAGSKTISHGGLGYARAPGDSSSKLMTSTTRSQLASVSKPLTAIGLMRLREMQPIDLDQPFLDYLDADYATGTGVSNVTVRNLLTHKSGMTPDGSCGGDDFRDEMAALIAKPLVGTPGVTSAYSNANFCLVRMVIEDVSGMDYVQFMQTYVFGPAGVTAMTCTPEAMAPTLYYAYDGMDLGGTYWTTDYTPSCAAYGWYASAQDLAKVLNALTADKILTAATRVQMLNEKLGWFNELTVNGNGKAHSGAWIKSGKASRTGLGVLPGDIGVVLLVNTNDFDPPSIMADGYDYTVALGGH